MGQSLVKNYIHIIFTTKYRQPWILPEIELFLHQKIIALSKDMDSPILAIGGSVDHLHILCNLSKQIALSAYLETLKSKSSYWIKGEPLFVANFYWQAGYAAFSVDPKNINLLVNYILNQKKHHETRDFELELKLLKSRYGVR
ncbi:IS200/IS605 family transposase [Saprospira grandis]|uniref:Transposase n=1 Tax=Saprospira grandis (strain Lewin) TaxID=984262 RepID=H6L1R0_SAPGL|nr:IS200/IS605 family transposase [Saprospira grandis]AFC26138.1 transposase [Saprospira grandis str. Lewin]